MSYAQTEKAVYLYGNQLNIPCPVALAPLAAGDVVVLGTCVGVALEPINVNNDPPGSLAVEGVFRFLKEPGVAFTLFEEVEWDAGNGVAIASAGGAYTDSASIGKCVAAAAEADLTVDVLLNPFASSASGA